MGARRSRARARYLPERLFIRLGRGTHRCDARLRTRRPVRAHRGPAAGDRALDRRAAPRARITRRCSARPAPARRRPWPGRSRSINQADPRPGPQQDARRPAVRRVPRVLPRTTRSSTSSATSTTTSPRRTCRAATRTSRRTRSRNDEIDRLRHAATHALFERRDVIIVASVSCIYGLAPRSTTARPSCRLRAGGQYRRDAVLRHLVDLQYQRNDQALGARPVPRPRRHARAPAGVRGVVVRVEFFGDEVERITELDPLTGELLAERKEVNVYPATHLRDAGRQAQGSHRRHRGRDGGAGRRARGRGARPGGRPTAPAHDVRPRDAARARLLHRRRELLAPPLPARGRLAAVDPARLLPAGLAPGRRRVAHDHPAGRRHVQERPDPQGDPGRLRVPAAVGARQPAADVRGVRGDRPPGDLHERDARAVRARAQRGASSSSSSGRPASSTRPSGPADRGPDRRPARGDPRAASSAASGPW